MVENELGTRGFPLAISPRYAGNDGGSDRTATTQNTPARSGGEERSTDANDC